MYQKTTLDNGLRIITSPMPGTHSVSTCIFIGVGSRYEPDTEAGISHFIEHLCFKGTPARPTAREIAEAIEGVGGILNGGTDKEITVYWYKVAQPHFLHALEVLADMLLHSKFDAEDIEKERQVIIEEINMSLDFPTQRVDMLIDELLWPRHPLGRDVAGSKESVGAITKDKMLDYLQGQYQPSNTVIAIAGNIEHQPAVSAVSQVFGNWAGHQPRSGYLPYQEKPVQRLSIETRKTEQTHLCLAVPGLSLRHPQRFALDLLNTVLGEGMSSRLFAEIRDKLGLAYSIHSHVVHYQDAGSITVYAGIEPKNLETAVKAILEQLVQLKELVPESELSRAKELTTGRLLLGMEDSRSVAGWLGGQEILTGQILNIDQTIATVNAITAEELRQLAQELIVDRQLRLALVGPAANVESLEELLKL